VVVRNKVDLPAAWAETQIALAGVPLSATTGVGVERLRQVIAATLAECEELRDPPALSNVRHIALLETAVAHLRRAADAAAVGVETPEEFLMTDLQQARASLEEITGRRTSDDVLKHIFERFCIGK
jgi:tRNA modification GTPase